MSEDSFIIWDARSGQVIPTVCAGMKTEDCYYPEKVATAIVTMMNVYLLLNEYPEKAAKVAKGEDVVYGPYHVKPAAERVILEKKPTRPMNKSLAVKYGGW